MADISKYLRMSNGHTFYDTTQMLIDGWFDAQIKAAKITNTDIVSNKEHTDVTAKRIGVSIPDSAAHDGGEPYGWLHAVEFVDGVGSPRFVMGAAKPKGHLDEVDPRIRHVVARTFVADHFTPLYTTPIADASKSGQVEAVAWQARIRGVDSEWQSISQPAYDEIVLNELWEKRALYLGPAPNAASLMPEDVDKLARELLADEYSLVGDDRVAGRIRRGNAFQDERVALRAITAALRQAAQGDE